MEHLKSVSRSERRSANSLNRIVRLLLFGFGTLIITIILAGGLLMFQSSWILSQLSNSHPDVLYSVYTDDRVIALTIDDGPDPETTPRILDALAEYGAHGTFFLLSDQISGNEEIVNRIVSEGHEIANHLNTDKPTILFTTSEFEQVLLKSHEALSSFDKVNWFRPGSGWFTKSILDVVKKNGYRTALGSIYPFDSQVPSSWFSTRYILWQIAPGSIIILHDRGARGDRTIDTLNTILPDLTNRGFEIMTLTDLVAYEE